MAKNSLNIPFALLISLLVFASVIIIRGELKKNRFQIETVKIDINMLKNQLTGITENINVYNQELSTLNLKVSVLNEELSYFNKSINGNGNDLTKLELKIKDVIADLRKVKNMTELQNRKLYVSE
tara:strand:- start:692 stop:1066 length:375 start_codon:yes stop_codon:yes gene_type:complete